MRATDRALEQIAEKIAEQGQATARTIDLSDVIGAIEDAINFGSGTHRREQVSNCYGYAAMSSAVDALKIGRKIHVGIDRSYSSSQSPLGLSTIQERWLPATKAKHLAEIIACNSFAASIVISTRTASKIVRDARLKGAAARMAGCSVENVEIIPVD